MATPVETTSDEAYVARHIDTRVSLVLHTSCRSDRPSNGAPASESCVNCRRRGVLYRQPMLQDEMLERVESLDFDLLPRRREVICLFTGPAALHSLQ